MPVYHQMLWDADLYLGRLVALVKQRDMWENSVWIYSADNGGTGVSSILTAEAPRRKTLCFLQTIDQRHL